MKVDGKVLSELVTRGVHQGSVFSPTLFLLGMDPLLRKLESSCLGLSVSGLFAGMPYLHADDTRTIANSSESLKA